MLELFACWEVSKGQNCVLNICTKDCGYSLSYMDRTKMVNNLFFLTLIIQSNHNHCAISELQCRPVLTPNTIQKNKHKKNIFNITRFVFNLGCKLICVVNATRAIFCWRNFKVTVVPLLLCRDACIFACAPDTL